MLKMEFVDNFWSNKVVISDLLYIFTKLRKHTSKALE